MPAPSLLQGEHVLVRLRESVILRGRLLNRHGQFGTLYVLPAADALALVEAGRAKLPAELKRQALRDHLAALA